MHFKSDRIISLNGWFLPVIPNFSEIVAFLTYQKPSRSNTIKECLSHHESPHHEKAIQTSKIRLTYLAYHCFVMESNKSLTGLMFQILAMALCCSTMFKGSVKLLLLMQAKINRTIQEILYSNRIPV